MNTRARNVEMHEVRDDDRAIFCEGEYRSWYHAQCVDISNDEYDSLTESEGKWSALNAKAVICRFLIVWMPLMCFIWISSKMYQLPS